MNSTTLIPVVNFSFSSTFSALFKQLVVATLYLLLGIIFQTTFSGNGIVSIIWPPSGLALAALLIGGKRYIWGIFLGSLILNVLLDDSLWAIGGITLVNVVEPLLGFWLLTRDKKSTSYLDSLPNYLHLIILGGVVASVFGAIVGPLSLLFSGFITPENYLQNVLHWWMGDTLGVVLITTLILAWHQVKSAQKIHKKRLANIRILEGVLLVVATFIVGQIVFLDWFHQYFSDTPKGYVMFLFVAWIAIRLKAQWVTLVVLMIAIQGLFGAYHMVGFFSHNIARAELFNYWSYMLIISTVGIAMTTYVEEVKRKSLRLQKSETQLILLVNAIPDLIWLKDTEGVYMSCNHMFERFFGTTEKNIIGKTDCDFVDKSLADSFKENDRKAMLTQEPNFNEEWLTFADNGYRGLFETTKMSLRDKEGNLLGVLGIAHDITERKQASDEIQRLAFYDPLTHLPNRRLLIDRLNQALAASARSGRDGAILFLDLDHFKTLNDSLGHDFGDMLLQQVAERLTKVVREGDTVARLGGDEYVIMLEDLSELALEAAAQAEMIGEKIIISLNQPYQLATHEYHSTPSIGVTLFSGHKQTQEELLKHADIAMYQAKKAGRNMLRFFDPNMQQTIDARVDLERELRKAIDQQQFNLYYQVQVGISERPLGAEALIRWVHPERGLISPAHFIPLAEETGLILPIGLWVLETACAQLKQWEQDPITHDLTISINVSAKQFHQSNFVTQVQAAVLRHAIVPMNLKIEITESILLSNIEDTIATMNALKNIGIHFSLDDFGTGYSSLQYLKSLPLTQLKIDQSFVRDIGTDNNDQAIVYTIIAMAKSLHLDVIAEGVETIEQQELLLNNGCLHYQGYLFGKPVPIDVFEAALRIA